MARQYARGTKTRIKQARRRNTAARARSSNRARVSIPRGQAATKNIQNAFSPPENWYEPSEPCDGFKTIVQSPGPGYRHILTTTQVRERLAELPSEFVKPLQVVQFSQMTRKKQSFPCYGMQWGTTIYLYPIEESLTETFYAPPRPALVNESKMYGGRWSEEVPGEWTLTWSEQAIQDFYLNNILIHELGHMLDERNSSYTDRERYAEWFATRHGYLATGGSKARRPKQKIRRRHHA